MYFSSRKLNEEFNQLPDGEYGTVKEYGYAHVFVKGKHPKEMEWKEVKEKLRRDIGLCFGYRDLYWNENDFSIIIHTD